MDAEQSTQASLGSVTLMPCPKPGYRYAPAKIGHTNDTSVIALIEEPLWCTEDHVAEPVVSIEDVMHRGDTASVAVTTGVSFGDSPVTSRLFAYLESDPVATNPMLHDAHITVEDGRGAEFAFMTPDMADQLANDFIGFASSLRGLARTARQHNAHTAVTA
jgi:hypothetical protein